LSVVDILAYSPFPLKFEASLDEALRLRPEIKAADLTIGQTQEAVKIARSDLYPTVSLAGNYPATDRQLTGDLSEDRWTIEGRPRSPFLIGENPEPISESKCR
jgi:outer membrane protein TolC